MPLPEEVIIPLSQHFGAPATPLVKKNDQVSQGDLIGSYETGLCAKVHSSVSGKVKAVEECLTPTGMRVPAIAIEVGPEHQERTYEPSDWQVLDSEELKRRIEEAGVVGMGGAGFPTHIKLSPPKEAKVDTLILNGAECEPYLTTDHALMREHPERVVEGGRIILRILGINRCLIGIELNKPDAIERMKEAISKLSGPEEMEVVPLKTKYPQGSEKQLIEALTGRKVPAFGLPFDVGVVVQNVATAHAIYEACVFKKPLFERVVTISGKGIKRQANLLVKIGTKISDIVRYLGGTSKDLRRVVIGGPMMGFAVPTLDLPVTKTTSGVLFLTPEEIDERPHRACIRCGFCLEACPMGLMPNEIGLYVEAGRAGDTGEFGVFECFECGSCAYVCPSKRPLVQFIRYAKSKARR